MDDGDELGFFDTDYRFVNTLSPLKIHSGLWLGNPFTQYGDEVLYWRQLENTIYAIRPDSTFSIKYTVDFGARTVPDRDFVDEYEQIDFINLDPNAYATFLSNVLETDDRVFFTFIYQSQKHLVVFDKSTKLTHTYHFTFPAGQTLNEIIPLPTGVWIVADEPDCTILYGPVTGTTPIH